MRNTLIIPIIVASLLFFYSRSSAHATNCLAYMNSSQIMNLEGSCTLRSFTDGSNGERLVSGVDSGTGTTNNASITLRSGAMTINSNETLVLSLVLEGGSVAIGEGAKIDLGRSLWMIDADGDGYSSNGQIYSFATDPGTPYRRLNQMISVSGIDCNDAVASTSNSCAPATRSVQALVIAGGGGAGNWGGGGGGGLVYHSGKSLGVGSHTVTVGGGGSGNASGAGSKGGNSVFIDITAIGGGAGGTHTGGGAGGSGGGQGYVSGPSGAAQQTNSGGGLGYGNTGSNAGWPYGSGGGGAGSIGLGQYSPTDRSDGGNGRAYSISGSSVTYAGGGGGYCSGCTSGLGRGGGGNGGSTGIAGVNGTGGGGGSIGGRGGNGVVIVSYTTGNLSATGGTVTTSGSNTIHTFTSTGTTSFVVSAITEPCASTTWYLDADNDDFGSSTNSTQACSQPEGYVANNIDCDDNSYSNTNNCNCTNHTLAIDSDQDGYYTGTPTNYCINPGDSTIISGRTYYRLNSSLPFIYIASNAALGSGDCHDGNAIVFPGQNTCYTTPYDLASGGSSFDYNCNGLADKCSPVLTHTNVTRYVGGDRGLGSCTQNNATCGPWNFNVYDGSSRACGQAGGTCTTYGTVGTSCEKCGGTSGGYSACITISAGTQGCN